MGEANGRRTKRLLGGSTFANVAGCPRPKAEQTSCRSESTEVLRVPMPSSIADPDSDAHTSSAPIGRTVNAHITQGCEDAEERAEFERLAAFEELARIAIMRRAKLGLSQAELARRMNAPRSVVSRIESGQHPTNTATLKRLAEALDGRAVVGFAFGPQPEASDMVQL